LPACTPQATGTVSTNVTCTQWRHIELRDIDWTARSFDVYIDGALIRTGTKFGGTGTAIAPIELFVYDTTSTGYWDQLALLP
jgi:hypothetical protein